MQGPYGGFIELVEAHIPPGFFVRLIEELEDVYASSYDNSHRFQEAEASDLLPYERRARAEDSLRQVAFEFEHRGIAAAAVMNSTNSNRHREVASDSIVITESFVPERGALVADADFRRQLAEDAQINWITPNRPKGDRLYGIILHGYKRIGDRKLKNQLGFVQLAIPNPECTSYLGQPYDLCKRYAAVDVDLADREAYTKRVAGLERIRRPSALLREYRRLTGSGE